MKMLTLFFNKFVAVLFFLSYLSYPNLKNSKLRLEQIFKLDEIEILKKEFCKYKKFPKQAKELC